MLYQINEDTSKKINDFFNQALKEQTDRNKYGKIGIDDDDIKLMCSELKGSNMFFSNELSENAIIERNNLTTNQACVFAAGELAVGFYPDPIGSDALTIVTKDGMTYRFNSYQNGYRNVHMLYKVSNQRFCVSSEALIELLQFCGLSLVDMVKSIEKFSCMCNYKGQDYVEVTSPEDCKFCKEKSFV